MIKQLLCVESTEYDPYANLAVEEYLLRRCQNGQCILYLWQNQSTVVIGRNQNAWKECLTGKLEAEGGHLARRLSGGGAVYHDLGNLNFTFLVNREDYRIPRQLEVILEAVRSLGVPAEKSGRNDLQAEGRKFSGNAFYEQEEHCYHHGTLMMHVNMEDMSRYLTVSREKLKSKGVDSVHARVVNLSEYVPGLTADQMKEALRLAFENVYGWRAKSLPAGDMDTEEIRELREKYASWEWLYGRKMEFQYEMSRRFSWGEVTLRFQADQGIIRDVQVYSDSLNPGLMMELPELLKGTRFRMPEIAARLRSRQAAKESERILLADMADWTEAEEQ